MDKRLIAERFARARDTYGQEARVQQQVAEKMLRLLKEHTDGRTFRRIAEFGCGTGSYSRLLHTAYHPDSLLLNDLCAPMEECVADLTCRPEVRFLAADAESPDFIEAAKGCDLLTSCSTLQWFVRPADFFRHCHDALPPQGVLAFSTFGTENLREIRRLTGHGLTYLSLPELENLLHEAGFHLLHAEEEQATLTFARPMDVLHHLKQTGVTGTEKKMWTRSRLQAFCQTYARLFACDGGEVTLTYHPIYLVTQKR